MRLPLCWIAYKKEQTNIQPEAVHSVRSPFPLGKFLSDIRMTKCI